ncbi:hypothetical protein J6590_085823 [Homalodisca vitripennis]|nr:hypothetical protein J6590_085823 [Homalodisca vitripennis]
MCLGGREKPANKIKLRGHGETGRAENSQKHSKLLPNVSPNSSRCRKSILDGVTPPPTDKSGRSGKGKTKQKVHTEPRLRTVDSSTRHVNQDIPINPPNRGGDYYMVEERRPAQGLALVPWNALTWVRITVSLLPLLFTAAIAVGSSNSDECTATVLSTGSPNPCQVRPGLIPRNVALVESLLRDEDSTMKIPPSLDTVFGSLTNVATKTAYGSQETRQRDTARTWLELVLTYNLAKRSLWKNWRDALGSFSCPRPGRLIGRQKSPHTT